MEEEYPLILGTHSPAFRLCWPKRNNAMRNEDRISLEHNMSLKYRLSWEAPDLLCLGADGVKPRYYKRTAGPLQAIPDIAFIGETHCLPLLKGQAFPDEIFVQEKSGNVFLFAGL